MNGMCISECLYQCGWSHKVTEDGDVCGVVSGDGGRSNGKDRHVQVSMSGSALLHARSDHDTFKHVEGR